MPIVAVTPKARVRVTRHARPAMQLGDAVEFAFRRVSPTVGSMALMIQRKKLTKRGMIDTVTALREAADAIEDACMDSPLFNAPVEESGLT